MAHPLVPWAQETERTSTSSYLGNGHPLNAVASHEAPKAAGTKLPSTQNYSVIL